MIRTMSESMFKRLNLILKLFKSSPVIDSGTQSDTSKSIEGVAINEEFKPSIEINHFIIEIERLLERFNMVLVKSYLKTETHSYWSPPRQDTFNFILSNKIINIEFDIFESDSSFIVNVSYSKFKSAGYKDGFTLSNFIDVTEFPRFRCDKALRGVEYLNLFHEYFKNLLTNNVMEEILTGNYWFEFYMHIRDQEFPIHLELRKEFLKSRNN
jgi:hypothetical protein